VQLPGVGRKLQVTHRPDIAEVSQQLPRPDLEEGDRAPGPVTGINRREELAIARKDER
jgi:hypothetical protein